jgi:hypothetical protein
MADKTANLNRDLLKRAQTTGVSRRIIGRFLPLVEKWIRSSGEEWTVGRLKSIKLDLLRKKAGLPPTSVWISRSHSSPGRLIFGGCIGQLESWMFSHPNRFSKGLQLLQIYTYFFAKKVTPSQKKKFVSAVLAPGLVLDKDIVLTLRRALRRISIPQRRGCLSAPDPIEFYQCSPSKRGPTPWGSLPEEESLIDSVGYLIRSFTGQIHLHRYKDLYDPLLCNVLPMLKTQVLGQSPYSDKGDKTLTVGRIGLIQESGYKLRAVANPGRVFQLVLGPLGDFLYNVLSRMPWDCTFDQSRAFPYVQRALQQGREVQSVDLSNATDFFPLALQEHTLRYLLPDAKDVDLFIEISKSKWIFPGLGEIQWNRGQPLGLYPSFASFALTHGLLLFGLLDRPFNGQFFILGDDVIILDHELAIRYKDVLRRLRCPIAESKSLSSAKLAEFAGKVITPEKVISQLKWRAVSDESFIDIARNIGPRVRQILRPRQLRVISEICDVPEFLGGLGWNPKGLPLEDRLKTWCFQDGSDSPRLMGYLRVALKNLYSSQLLHRSSIPEDFVYCYTSALDQRASHLVSEAMGDTFVPLMDLLGTNLDRIFKSLDRDLDLPIKGVSGTFISNLQKFERKLGLSRTVG